MTVQANPKLMRGVRGVISTTFADTKNQKFLYIEGEENLTPLTPI
jgi:hypothetical protein